MGDSKTIARRAGLTFSALAAFLGGLLAPVVAAASEADLVLPDLSTVKFDGLGGVNGKNLLLGGIAICVLGLAFGLVIFNRLKNLPVHKSMLEISELIYATCKTYLETQGKFILLLEVFIGAIMVAYFRFFAHKPKSWGEVAVIILFKLIGIAGSYGVA